MAERPHDPPGRQSSPTGPAPPVVNYVGERVALGPPRPDQHAAFNRWENDPFVMRTWEWLPRPRTLAMTVSAWEQGLFAESTSDLFALYERATWRLIGYTGLVHIDHANRLAEFGILIGEADARGQGYGTEATRLVLDHTFLAGRRAYEKAGFRVLGVRRRRKLMGGTLWDTVYMEALAVEFASPALGRILVPDRARE